MRHARREAQRRRARRRSRHRAPADAARPAPRRRERPDRSRRAAAVCRLPSRTRPPSRRSSVNERRLALASAARSAQLLLRRGDAARGRGDNRVRRPSGGAGSRRCCLRRGWCDGRGQGCRCRHRAAAPAPRTGGRRRWCATAPSLSGNGLTACDRAATARHLTGSGHSMLARLRARQADRADRLGRRRARRPRQAGESGGAGGRVSIGAAKRRQPSLDPLFRLLAADLDRVNALIVERMHSPVALIPQLAGHIVAAGGKRLRPMLTLGCARLCGYRGEPAHRARRRRRVHPHRDAAARRRRRFERPAPRPRHGQRRVGQQAGGAGRRFPVRPLVRADGRGRLAAHPRDPVARRRGDRRGRGRPAGHRQRHRDDRGAPISK